MVEDGVVRLSDRPAEHGFDRCCRGAGFEGFDGRVFDDVRGHRAGDLAGRVAAHAVGHEEETDLRAAPVGVFVGRALEAPIGRRANHPFHSGTVRSGSADGKGRHADCPRTDGAMSRMRRLFALSVVVAFLGCEPRPEDDRMSEPPPPPAALIAPVRESMSLDEKLARLEAELDAALARDDLDALAIARLYRAEAITDRILETDPAIVWLDSDYDAESWLRQLQALADRVVAQIRRDAPEERIREDAVHLRERVMELRKQLTRSNGRMPPPPLDSLLRSYEVDSMQTEMQVVDPQ